MRWTQHKQENFARIIIIIGIFWIALTIKLQFCRCHFPFVCYASNYYVRWIFHNTQFHISMLKPFFLSSTWNISAVHKNTNASVIAQLHHHNKQSYIVWLSHCRMAEPTKYSCVIIIKKMYVEEVKQMTERTNEMWIDWKRW